jgi:hypothetical protein
MSLLAGLALGDFGLLPCCGLAMLGGEEVAGASFEVPRQEFPVFSMECVGAQGR